MNYYQYETDDYALKAEVSSRPIYRRIFNKFTIAIVVLVSIFGGVAYVSRTQQKKIPSIQSESFNLDAADVALDSNGNPSLRPYDFGKKTETTVVEVENVEATDFAKTYAPTPTTYRETTRQPTPTMYNEITHVSKIDALLSPCFLKTTPTHAFSNYTVTCFSMLLSLP